MPNQNDVDKINKMQPQEVNIVDQPRLQAALAELTAEADALEAKIKAETKTPARDVIPRPYVSIDIETTGLDPDKCQILEIGVVLEDWNSPIEKLARFHCYVVNETITGEEYALNLNKAILERIDNRHLPENAQYKFLSPGQVAADLNGWLMANSVIDDVGGTVLAAGKNFASFDRQFLKRLPEFEAIKFHHRNIDPGMLFWNPEIDAAPPSSKECMERAGIPGEVLHTAIADAETVIAEVRFAVTLRKIVFTLAEVRVKEGVVYIEPTGKGPKPEDTNERRKKIAAELAAYFKETESAAGNKPDPNVTKAVADRIKELQGTT